MGLLHFCFSFFLGCPDAPPPRAIFYDFGRPLGASWGYLGAILAPYWLQLGHLGSILVLSWRIFGHLGDHVDLLGRSVALWWLSWLVFGPNFNSLDVQTKKIATILASPTLTCPFDVHLLQHVDPQFAKSSCSSRAFLHAAIWLQHHQFANTRFLMPLEFLSHLCVKVSVEQRGRSCAQRSCEPDTCYHLFAGTTFLHATNWL